jgi:hypothetical protein
MRYKHKPIVVEAAIFRPGMETGIHTSERIGREPWDTCTVESPYIMHNYKKIWINFGDVLITEKDGTKYAISRKDFKKYFEKITDENELKLDALLWSSNNG